MVPFPVTTRYTLPTFVPLLKTGMPTLTPVTLVVDAP
jgi:hypothetical protein